MPGWLDISLRIAAAITVIGGIMWLALRRTPDRDPDASDRGGFGNGGGDAGAGHDSGHGGSGEAAYA